VMRRGFILESGTRDQIFLNPQHAYTRSLLGAVPTLSTDRNEPLATLAGSYNENGTAPGILTEKSPGHWVRSIPQV
jgi:peptide/nickel transport system ATP-binding protein